MVQKVHELQNLLDSWMEPIFLREACSVNLLQEFEEDSVGLVTYPQTSFNLCQTKQTLNCRENAVDKTARNTMLELWTCVHRGKVPFQ